MKYQNKFLMLVLVIIFSWGNVTSASLTQPTLKTQGENYIKSKNFYNHSAALNFYLNDFNNSKNNNYTNTTNFNNWKNWFNHEMDANFYKNSGQRLINSYNFCEPIKNQWIKTLENNRRYYLTNFDYKKFVSLFNLDIKDGLLWNDGWLVISSKFATDQLRSTRRHYWFEFEANKRNFDTLTHYNTWKRYFSAQINSAYLKNQGIKFVNSLNLYSTFKNKYINSFINNKINYLSKYNYNLWVQSVKNSVINDLKNSGIQIINHSVLSSNNKRMFVNLFNANHTNAAKSINNYLAWYKDFNNMLNQVYKNAGISYIKTKHISSDDIKYYTNEFLRKPNQNYMTLQQLNNWKTWLNREVDTIKIKNKGLFVIKMLLFSQNNQKILVNQLLYSNHGNYIKSYHSYGIWYRNFNAKDAKNLKNKGIGLINRKHFNFRTKQNLMQNFVANKINYSSINNFIKWRCQKHV